MEILTLIFFVAGGFVGYLHGYQDGHKQGVFDRARQHRERQFRH